MDAIGSLRKFADGHKRPGAPLVVLMKDDTLRSMGAPVTDPSTDNPGIKDYQQLRAVWDAEQLRLGRSNVSQKAMALEWGVNPSLITQYLNGHIPLNIGAQLRFARYLNKPVLEIWPQFELAGAAPGDLPPEAIQIAAVWNSLLPPAQKIVSDLVRSLAGLPVTP